MAHDVFEGIGRAADEKLLAQHLPGFGHGHVLQPQVYAVGMEFLSQLHVVVDDEDGSVMFAQGLHFAPYCLHFVQGVILHAQLYPAATAFQSQTGTVQVGVPVGVVGNELYGYHRLILHKLL